MKYARGEQRQHIALSHHAHEILLSDISAFSEKGKLSGIINCVLRSLAVVGAVSSGRSAVGERSTGVLYRPAVVYKLLAFL